MAQREFANQKALVAYAEQNDLAYEHEYTPAFAKWQRLRGGAHLSWRESGDAVLEGHQQRLPPADEVALHLFRLVRYALARNPLAIQLKTNGNESLASVQILPALAMSRCIAGVAALVGSLTVEYFLPNCVSPPIPIKCPSNTLRHRSPLLTN
jgi:hypothetical protein